MGTIPLQVKPSSDLYTEYICPIELKKIRMKFFAISIFEVSSSSVDVPQIKRGYLVDKSNKNLRSCLNVSYAVNTMSNSLFKKKNVS